MDASSTLTVLFTDIEGSTSLLRRLGDRYAELLEDHHRLVCDAVSAANGRILGSAGDGLFAAFPTARQALRAALVAQNDLATREWPDHVEVRVRMALHSGELVETTAGLVGTALHEVARILAGAHGGQIVLSGTTRGLLDADALDGLALRDLGVHRVHDIADAVHLFQVAEPGRDCDFPPLRLAHAELPLSLAFATSFVGRVDELARLDRLLEEARLITVVGPGGTGKTRLAIEVARRAADRMTNIAFVELGPISDPAALPAAIAATISDASLAQDPLERTIDVMRNGRSLLILDNCEHMLDACADITGVLIRRCPELCVLATSRHPIDVVGEQVVALAPLAPDEAVALLVDRARSAHPAFVLDPDTAEPLADICRQVAGIPLALELAAARLRALPARELAERLQVLDLGGNRTAPPRHRTLRTALEWSHKLLSPSARVLFRRLGVFADFDLTTARAVCWDGPDRDGIETLTDELVAASMVVFEQGRGRYTLLEPLRRYALEQLDAAGEYEAQRERHARYFLRVAQHEFQAVLRDDAAHSALVANVHNLELALSWADERDEVALLNAVGALAVFWAEHETDQGVRWTERAVARSRGVDPLLRGDVLITAASAHINSAERDASWAEEAVDIFRSQHQPDGLAWSLYWVGRYYSDTDPRRAQLSAQEALEGLRELDHKFGIAACLHLLGRLAADRGDDHAALTLWSEALECKATALSIEAAILIGLAEVALRAGDFATAVERAREAVASNRLGTSPLSLGLTLTRAAWVELAAGERAGAALHLHDALTLARQTGSREMLAIALIVAAHKMLDDGDPATARALLATAGWHDRWTVARESLAHVRAGLAVLASNTTTVGERELTLDAAVDEMLVRLAREIPSSQRVGPAGIEPATEG